MNGVDYAVIRMMIIIFMGKKNRQSFVFTLQESGSSK